MKKNGIENIRGSDSFHLYLHPYVHVSVKKDKAILYNTENQALLEYKAGGSIYKLIKRLNSDDNLYVVTINTDELSGDTVKFIKRIRETYIGDVVDAALSGEKPAQLKPILNRQPTEMPRINGDSPSNLLALEEIPDLLDSMTIYINDYCMNSCPICSDAYKQVLCCKRKPRGSSKTLHIDDIKTLVLQAAGTKLYKINISGGDIFLYPELPSLIDFLNNSPSRILKEYQVHCLNIRKEPEIARLMAQGNNRLCIIIHFPIPGMFFDLQMKNLCKYFKMNNIGYRFIVQSENDIEDTEDIISKYGLTDHVILPYYNGKNFSFFRDQIFPNTKDIISFAPDINDILERSVLNSNYFKHLGILPDKAVHANFNHPKIGILGKQHILDLVDKEFHYGKSWTAVRKNISPCKSCVFNALCPPISNYEYAIGRYNLCRIFKPGKQGRG